MQSNIVNVFRYYLVVSANDDNDETRFVTFIMAFLHTTFGIS